MSTGVYIHVPFCKRKCLYCDFASFTCNHHDKYFKALLKEADMYDDILSVDKIDSIFFGGGTPSLVHEKYICEVIERLKPEKNAEITVEANPGTLNPEKLKAYIKNGVNRLSIGLQSANDNELEALGRIHNFNEFLKSYESAVNAGFSNINVDIMFGIPKQTVKSFSHTLEEVFKLNPTHISCYSLIIEEGTPFYDMKLELPSEESEREMYNMMVNNDKGYERYEISNFARKGFECKHNLKYWRFGNFLGLGLNAYSFSDNKRYSNFADFDSYFNAINAGKKPVSEVENESKEELIKDYVITAFRLTEGVIFSDFNGKFGENFEEKYKKQLEKFEGTNHIKRTPLGVSFTDKGFEVSNYILSEFI